MRVERCQLARDICHFGDGIDQEIMIGCDFLDVTPAGGEAGQVADGFFVGFQIAGDVADPGRTEALAVGQHGHNARPELFLLRGEFNFVRGQANPGAVDANLVLLDE